MHFFERFSYLCIKVIVSQIFNWYIYIYIYIYIFLFIKKNSNYDGFKKTTLSR